MMKKLQLILCALLMSSTATLVVSCGPSEHSLLDKAQSEIDQRHYRQAIQILEDAGASPTSPAVNTKLAYAYLGAAGVEFSDLAKNVQTLQKFDHHHFSLNSLPLIQLTNAPAPENADLSHAFELFDRAYPDVVRAPQEINLLIAALKLTLSIEYYNRLASIHAHSDVERATLTIVNVKHSLLSIFDGLHRLYYSYGKIKRFLTAVESKPLLRIGNFSYYLSENVTISNFFDFLTHSTEVTLEDGIEQRANDPRGLGQFLNDLSQNLLWLRNQADLDASAVSAITSQLIQISARIAPKSISLKPVITRVSLAPVRLKDEQLPHFLRRMVHAVDQAWELEDAKVLFDEHDHLKESVSQLQQIAANWQAEPAAVGDKMPAWLVEKTLENLKDFPSLEINPESPDSIVLVKQYFNTLGETLKLWTSDSSATRAEEMITDEIRTLLQRTNQWISDNL